MNESFCPCQGLVEPRYEGFATLPNQAFGGMDRGMLKMLNRGNMNVEGFDIYDSYQYVPAGMSGLETKGVQASDPERTALMGQPLETEMNNINEGLALKNYQTDRGFVETPEGDYSWSEGPTGMTVS